MVKRQRRKGRIRRDRLGIRGMRSGHRPVVSIDRPLIWETHPYRSNTCRGFGSLLKVCFLALHELAFLLPSLAVTSAICSHSSCQALELPHLPAFKLKDGVQHATRMQFFHHRPRTHQNQCRCCRNWRRTILRNLLCIHLPCRIYRALLHRSLAQLGTSSGQICQRMLEVRSPDGNKNKELLLP